MVARQTLWKVGKKKLKAVVPEVFDFPWVGPPDCTANSMPYNIGDLLAHGSSWWVLAK